MITRMPGLRHYTLLGVLLLLLAGCDDADNRYSTRYPCTFVFYTQYHTSSLLSLSLGNPGSFVIVTATMRQGVTHLQVTANSGESEDMAMTTAIENERLSYQYMGANRSLIIGQSLFDGLKAYDRQCPNCLETLGGVNYPLAFSGSDGQTVTCARCSRSYNLRAEGMPTNGKEGDKRLLEYVVAPYDGQRLYIHN